MHACDWAYRMTSASLAPELSTATTNATVRRGECRADKSVQVLVDEEEHRSAPLRRSPPSFACKGSLDVFSREVRVRAEDLGCVPTGFRVLRDTPSRYARAGDDGPMASDVADLLNCAVRALGERGVDAECLDHDAPILPPFRARS